VEKVEVIVVGAGLAGLACAYCLAKEGIEVLVLERGDYPGSKNVTGGRLYLNPVKEFFPEELWLEAPFERHVVREKLVMMSEKASTTVELFSQDFDVQPYHSYTLLRGKFDRWLAEKAMEQGALIIPKRRVDDLIYQDGKVKGIKVGTDEIQANVVVAADGALSFLAEKAGLRTRQDPKHFALGVKEIIELPSKTIEDRFNLEKGQGASCLFFGAITSRVTGGGFLYTNYESLSLGMVVGIRSFMDTKGKLLEAPQLLEGLKGRPEIRSLIEGGNLTEYSAHIIPEGGISAMPRLFTDGLLVVGDAAGLALNMLVTVRGMDFALASGALAAQAIKRAKGLNDFSQASLSYYQELLKNSFVLKDMQTFRHVFSVLDNPRMLTLYPQVFCDLLQKLMWIGNGPKERLSSTVLKAIKRLPKWQMLKDALSLLKI